MASIIVVQGSPAVGKSTLVSRLTEDLCVGLLAKDHIKELLFDTAGLPASREESTMYGRAAMDALFAIARNFLKAEKNFIMESAFFTDFANDDLKKLEKDFKVKLIQIFCFTDSKTMQQRYTSRIQNGQRHPGHGDLADLILQFEELAKRYRPLDIAQTFHVDTTSLSDAEYNKVVAKVKTIMEAENAKSH